MKVKAVFILFISFLIIACYWVFIKEENNTNTTRKPGENMSNKAIWIGGIDGGNWYLIDSVLSPTSFKIKIFNDNTYEIESDTVFELNADCYLKEIDSLTLLRNINGFDGERIFLAIPDRSKRCFLLPK